MAIGAARNRLAPADFPFAQRFRAVLDQGIGAHVIVGADHQVAQRIHQGEVAIAAIAGAEEIADQHVELAVAQPLADVGDELLLFGGADIPEVVDRLGRLQRAEIFVMIGDRGIIEDDDRRGLAAAGEILVIGLDGRADVAQAIGRDHEMQVAFAHKFVLWGFGNGGQSRRARAARKAASGARSSARIRGSR